MSCSEDERDDFGAPEEHSVLHGKLGVCPPSSLSLLSPKKGPSLCNLSFSAMLAEASREYSARLGSGHSP